MKELIVRGAPNKYICKEGILDNLEAQLLLHKITRVLFVTGEKSWNAASRYIPEFKEIEGTVERYRGECSILEISRIAKLAIDLKVEAIIGVGGGKIVDLVKAASNKSNTKTVIIPTLASNCAPWTPLSVIYTEEGVMTHYEVYTSGIELVLVEPHLLLDAPIDLFVAGIGDTLAKWYEADVQISRLEERSVPIEIAYFAALQCKDVLLEHSNKALQAVRTRTMNTDFIKVVETIIVYAGMVGGFGDSYGRIAGAHSIHNGLTVESEMHNKLHGEKVAYGILVQLVMEDKLVELKSVITFYKELGLPISLKDLGLLTVTEDLVFRIAEKATLPNESIHVLKEEGIHEKDVSTAIFKLESMHY
ncbi:iron-containing alcohol dehydrogenase family protein [Sporosarcina siberiensis]|uniref:Iron-containing alcohol dehydrogenase family protein n=1 Tax=Sporosarcina siberiensis TaxID=1365606 RepID=A0ABW4SFI5_9BACL